MTFDRYFDLSDGMNLAEMVASFAVGVCPKATQRSYMDLHHRPQCEDWPVSSAACKLAAGIISCEIVKILLNNPGVKAAPIFTSLIRTFIAWHKVIFGVEIEIQFNGSNGISCRRNC